jgi:diacylglycerol kinase family enzyme
MSFQAPELILRYNGITRQQKFFNMSMAICKFNGGGMIPAPFADPADGMFDVTTFDDMSIMTVLKDYPKLRAGTIFKNPKIRTFRTDRIEVEKVGGADFVEADGEYVGKTPATFSIQKQALRFIVGAIPEKKEFPF